MKLLLTGASGFLGKNFLENAPKDWEITAIYHKSKDILHFIKEKKLDNVKAYQCDLTDEASVQSLFRKIGNHFWHCLYLAGNVNLPLASDDPRHDLMHTAASVINVLQHGRFGRFVYVSSAGVYDGNKGKITIKTSLHPTNPYCISKLAAERYVHYFHKKKTIKSFAIIRFGGAFGKYSEHKFMTKVVRSLLENKREIEVYGDGTNIINVMYVKDTIAALIKALNSKEKEIVCNLGSKNLSVSDAIRLGAKALGKKIRIKYVPKNEKQKYIGFYYDSDFNQIFDFKPKYTFEEGIRAFAKDLR